MELLFSSASTLGLNYEFEFIGENFNFRNRKDLTIEGELLALNNFSGVDPIWSGVSGIISTQQEYSNILLNGISFGSGRLNSISFAPGLDVRRKSYTASFSVYSSGNIDNLIQSGYSGLYSGFSANDFKNLSSLNETFDFQKNPDKTFTYNRQLDISLLSGSPINAQAQAKNIATFLFRSDVTFPFLNSQYPSFYEESGKKLYSENYNLIRNEYSFSESFSFQDSNNYIWTYSHTTALEINGDITVTERGKFKGVNSSDYTSALAGFNANFTSHYARCAAILTYYYSGCSLQATPISIEISRDTFTGEISYTVSFSTNPKYVGGVIWDYTYGAERNDGTFSVYERGSVIGLGVRTGRYAVASAYFTATVLPSISTRISTYYSGFSTFLGVACAATFQEESRSITDAEFDGKVEYSFNYSNDSRLRSSNGLNFLESNISNSAPVPLLSTAAILGDMNSEYAIPVYRGNSSLGKFSFNIKLIPSGATSDINSLVQQAKSQISKSLIPSNEYYLKNVTYNYDFNNKSFDLNAEYGYVKYRTFNDIRII